LPKGPVTILFVILLDNRAKKEISSSLSSISDDDDVCNIVRPLITILEGNLMDAISNKKVFPFPSV